MCLVSYHLVFFVDDISSSDVERNACDDQSPPTPDPGPHRRSNTTSQEEEQDGQSEKEREQSKIQL